MKNLFGEEYADMPKKRNVDKERIAWENAFQRWSNKGKDGE